ncbi:hypothetical protein OG302_42835 [Streptomyces sp. NBC_01283]|uniref:hypothetical protein n=1 Tax=Streptomyces sp. NBC_01283 TaxID=2903812 RepID=UPI00352C3C93|nr:hypothetical protein OG302_42835 [Streptomyces sp. NBC_01283]
MQRLENLLEDPNTKPAVVSGPTRVSGRALLQALIEGERGAQVLAKPRLRSMIPELTDRLTARVEERWRLSTRCRACWTRSLE